MSAVKAHVNVLLQMLDACAHSKGLWLHNDLTAAEHFKGISCAVTYGKYHGANRYLIASVHGNRAQSAV